MTSFFWMYLSLIIGSHARSPCDEVPFVTRADWGAREPTSITNLTRKPLSYYVIHHTYQPPNCYDDVECIQRVKDIQDLHQLDRGWADIGYHFLVGENGKVYEGRGWNREAAHSPGWNNDAFGICIIGNFMRVPPNEKALSAVRSWIDCGIERGHVTQIHYIITHRQSQQVGYTECPGFEAFNVVKTWPRFCPFQNTGANLTANETLPLIARRFCETALDSRASSPRHLLTYFLLISLYFM